MGKRKTAKFPKGKSFTLRKLPTEFDCPFCSRQATCSVTMDKSRCVGIVKCRICSEEFRTQVHKLSEAVDVYADWIDACDKINH